VKAIVGLGNPGRAYAHTRHNVGFDVLDIVARRHRCRILGRRHRALVGAFERFGEEVLLIKPQTYMNESGQSVGEFARRHRLDPGDILVVYDDMDLPLGRIRVKPSGSSGGHRGMNSIIHHLRSSDFPRLRIGIGRGGEAVDHVLSRFNRKDRALMDVALEEAADAVDMMLDEGLDATMNRYNRTQGDRE